LRQNVPEVPPMRAGDYSTDLYVLRRHLRLSYADLEQLLADEYGALKYQREQRKA